MNGETMMQQLILRPHFVPFNFAVEWSHPLWKRCGV